MKPDCIEAVRAAGREIGKTITDGQIADIDARMQRTMRQLARTEEGWQALSEGDRLAMAAQRAVEDVQAEAARKVLNAQRQVIKTAATEQRIAAMLRLFDGDKRAHALVRDMQNIQHDIHGIRNHQISRLMDLMDAVKDGEGASPTRRVAMMLFDAENPAMTRDLATEIYAQADGRTGNKAAAEGAKAWLKVIDDLRGRFNGAGGDIGKLDYGYLPQPHDAARVRAAGRDKWLASVFEKVDRSRFVDASGARLGDAEVMKILEGIHETIRTEGINKMEPGQFKGSGARANRGMDHRELHFKDADAYLAYMSEFGGGTMHDAMMGHIGRMARDIGLVEAYGPNPNAQVRLQFDLAAKADGTRPDALDRTFGMRPETYWSMLNGTTSTPNNARLSAIGTAIRNIQTFGKLAGAVVSSVTDIGTYVVTTGYNRLGYWQAISNIGRMAASKDWRDMVTAHGAMAESMIGDMNRWHADTIAQTWSGRLANSTMKLSLMNAWTDTLRRAFSVTMMQGLARLSKTEWGKLTEWDRTHLERKGITEADWKVITKAELTEFGGQQHLTPEAIKASGADDADAVVSKVLGLIQDESEYAVINPDLATKGIASMGGTQAGTVRGELARSVMQFKSFPTAMISRHWRRVLESPKVEDGSAPVMADRLAYAAALMVSTTALGAIATQAKQLIAGKDPIDMTGEHAGKFWAKALSQGGGLSIAGDMLLTPHDRPTDWLRAVAGTALGPAASTVVEGLGIAKVNAERAIEGKPTHAAAETANLVRANAPLVNLWYARAALDRAGLHAMQENLSPGYLSRMRQRSQKEWGQGSWWAPGKSLPDRAPDFGKAVGQ